MKNHLVWRLAAASFCRFLLNTGRRFVYPFAAAFSRGLGIPLTTITSLIAMNQIASLLSPLFGPLSDRWGYRTMMVLALVLASTGMVAVALFPLYGVLMVGLFVLGIGKSIFDPALHAYVGIQVAYAQRGLAVGLLEISWAASSLIGIPVAGVLIDAYGWRAPFAVLGVTGLVGAVLLRWILPPADRSPTQTAPLHLLSAWRMLLRARTARMLIIYAFLANCANDIFFIVYGLWLAETFDLGIVAVGFATTIIGVAELMGEGLTATLADRIGLQRTMMLSLLATALCYGFLPLWGYSLTGALIGIFLLFLAFEFNIVTTVSFATEVLPTARATMMATYQAASGTGRICGAVAGGFIWLAGGITATGLTSAALCCLGFIVLQWGIKAEGGRLKVAG